MSMNKKLSSFLKRVAVLLMLSLCMTSCAGNPVPAESSETKMVTVPTEAPVIRETQPAQTMPTETEPPAPAKLQELALLHEENPDLWGWIRIEGTEVDYPLMYTPNDPEKYLRMDFEGNYSVAGLPFLDSDCTLDPESDNLIIYGHNMRDGSMFRSIMMYKDRSYWEEHPTILLSTLYEEREYEIMGAFYDRVYYKYEDCFKFYQFIDAEDEAHFDEAVAYFKENAEYDTDVTAEYGERLITLVTCSYHHEYGRFVVVAREKAED